MTTSGPALAAVAARAATAGSPAVRFDVTHFGHDAQPALTDITPPTARDRVATETHAFHLAGVGFQLNTWVPATPSKQMDGVTNSRITVSPRDAGTQGSSGRLFCGTVVINPDFHYDTAHSAEILLTLGDQPWQPDYADSLMIALAYEGMASAAAADGGAGAPVLFLQSPVAPFRDPSPRYRDDGSGEAPRVANGLALRMLVGMDVTNRRKRITLVCQIAALAAKHGFGLQLADRRFGRVRGEWWTVLPLDKKRYAASKKELFGWAPAGVPAAAELITFIGPARVGSSAAIAADLLARNIGILAVSEASLQEVAFVNLLVPVAPARVAKAGTAGAVRPIAEGIGRAASACGLTRRQDVRTKSRIADSAAADYQVLRTGPVRPRIEQCVRDTDHPVWLSWGIPLERDPARRLDVASLVVAQLREATDRVTGCRIDSYRGRVLPGDQLTARAKLTVSLRPGVEPEEIPKLLSELCPWAQREVVSRLVREDVPLNAIRLRLAWRERWLGRSGSVI